MKNLTLFALVFALTVVSVRAQTPTAAPSQTPTATAQPGGTNLLSTSIKRQYGTLKEYVTEAAEKMSEADYAFKPTPEIRSFGELIGHVANINYGACARAKGEKNPNDGNNFEKKTAKADLVKGIKDAVSYCDTVYESLTDATALEVIKVGQTDTVRAAPLISNISHTNEHYGNIVTYMRLKGLVPPSTERAPMRRPSGL